MINLAHVDEVVKKGIADGVFPGACYAVGFKGETQVRAHGRHMYCPDSPAVDEQTMWDLASCTKVIGCTTAAMLMFDEKKLKLEQPVAELIPEFGVEGKEKVTVRNLLMHISGLPGGTNVHSRDSGWPPERVLEAIFATKLKNPVGTKMVYSDLNMVVLAAIIEKLSGKKLDELLAGRVFGPLGMQSSMYRPGEAVRKRCAPTEAVEPWRLRVREERGQTVKPAGEQCHPDAHLYIQGDVHDPTAFMLGGVTGNAGLFSTAGDLAAFATMMLGAWQLTKHLPMIAPETIQDWTRRQESGDPESTRGLGWDTRSHEKSSAGHFFSKSSFGHTGYTGTSIWIDPEHQMFAVLLSNRVHPVADSGDHTRIGGFRPGFHDAVAKACGLGS